MKKLLVVAVMLCGFVGLSGAETSPSVELFIKNVRQTEPGKYIMARGEHALSIPYTHLRKHSDSGQYYFLHDSPAKWVRILKNTVGYWQCKQLGCPIKQQGGTQQWATIGVYFDISNNQLVCLKKTGGILVLCTSATACFLPPEDEMSLVPLTDEDILTLRLVPDEITDVMRGGLERASVL